MLLHKIWVTFLISGMIFASAHAPARAASQAQVIDGDTIMLDGETVRFEGIDCPEHLDPHETLPRWPEQPGAREATQELIDMIDGQPVRCDLERDKKDPGKLKRDQWGRVYGTCYAGGVNLNRQLVRRGRCWSWYRTKGPYIKPEQQACADRAGIWATDDFPMHPQRWRHDDPMKKPRWPCKR